MQTEKLPFDTSFIQQFQWSEPDRDIDIVTQIVRGHSDDAACPAGASDTVHILRLLASNPNTPAMVLDHLVRCSPNHQVLERIANNPNVSTETLRILARHDSLEVRCAVAETANADGETVTLLVNDENADVRFRLAENHDLPERVLELLCCDDNPYVAHRAQITRARAGFGSRPVQQMPLQQERSIKRAV